MIRKRVPASSSFQRGYTLLEMMISLLIGAVMIGAVLLAISGTGFTGSRQGGNTQVSEDGQIALNLIAGQLRLAGFWTPPSLLSSLHPQTPMLFGCRNGFSNVTVAAFASLTCTAGIGNDSVAVRYDAREPGTVASDCLGAAIPAGAGGMVDNRFYITTGPSGNPALFCRGNGGGNAQMLVDNVESLQIRYGIAEPTPPNTATSPEVFDRSTYAGRTIRYLRANELATTCPRLSPTLNAWCAVTAVRICMIVRTATGVGQQGGTPFINCDGTQQTIADTRLRRTMVTTVSLRNRMP